MSEGLQVPSRLRQALEHASEGLKDTRQTSIIMPMASDLDIYRSANVLIRQHGEDALLEAAMRADAMLEKGDLDGYAVWKRILRAVEDWRRTEPEDSELRH